MNPSTTSCFFIAAATLPLLAALIAKAPGKGFDNNNPRRWLDQQHGYRARANAAQKNLFEGLPLFYVAALFALYSQVNLTMLRNLMALWIMARLAYLAFYLANKATLRSMVWFVALIINFSIFFVVV